MKKFSFTWFLIILNICAIAVVLLWPGVSPRRGLVINKFDGTVAINTHPQQPMELNPWQQPRMVINMEWYATNKHEASVVLSFISMSKKGKLCAGSVFLGGTLIGQAEHEYRIIKNGLWETAYVNINIDVLNQLVFAKMPLKVRVCGVEFFPHKYEAEDLRQAVELWREW